MEKIVQGNGGPISISFDELLRNGYNAKNLDQLSTAQRLFRSFDQMHFQELMTAWATSIGYQVTFWQHGKNLLGDAGARLATLTPVA